MPREKADDFVGGKRDFDLTVGSVPHNVSCCIKWLGNDLVAHIYGGTLPHVGAVAAAVPRPSLKNNSVISSSASVLTMTGHKEDELAKHISLKLSAALHCTAVVVAGVHIDKADEKDIEQLCANADQAVNMFLEKVKNE